MDKAAAARDIILLDALAEVRAAASGAGVDLVALKGAALLERGLYAPGERGMTDVDLLLRPRCLAAFEEILRGLGYAPMPHSADAWVRPGPGAVPPAIIDIHTGLWHINNTDELFDRGLEPGPEGQALGLADLLLHAAAHPLLHHGEFTAKNLEDCLRLARKGQAMHGAAFWSAAAGKTGLYGLRPVLWPAVTRLLAAGALTPETAAAFKPRGAEKIKTVFFEKAARRRSGVLEYLLPVLYRPALGLRYLFPATEFMRRRYGSAGAAVYLLRPLRLLRAMFRG